MAALCAIVSVMGAWTIAEISGNVGVTMPVRLFQMWSWVQRGERNQAGPNVLEILILLVYAAALFALVLLLPE